MPAFVLGYCMIYLFALQLGWAHTGVFWGVFVSETGVGLFTLWLFTRGRWKTARGRTCVSFRTTDGAGPYHTAACLVGASVVGQTWAEHRNFLFNWEAARG